MELGINETFTWIFKQGPFLAFRIACLRECLIVRAQNSKDAQGVALSLLQPSEILPRGPQSYPDIEEQASMRAQCFSLSHCLHAYLAGLIFTLFPRAVPKSRPSREETGILSQAWDKGSSPLCILSFLSCPFPSLARFFFCCLATAHLLLAEEEAAIKSRSVLEC